MPVTVWLDRTALDELQAITEHRRGIAASRSAVVREAIAWLRAREARWLVRQAAQAAKLAREAAEEAAQLTLMEREARALADDVATALALMRGDRIDLS